MLSPDASLPWAATVQAVPAMIEAIRSQRDRLSEIDGAIGDGDHGVNMSKGFGLCRQALDALLVLPPLPQALQLLARGLMDDIGGSMGPLYGSLFLAMADTLDSRPWLDAAGLGAALAAGTEAVLDMGGARAGDKTLVDVLLPARDAYQQALARGESWPQCLRAMQAAAAQGLESTRMMQARLGRAARLGPRSVGVLDAGAASCELLLRTLAAAVLRAVKPPAD